MRHALILAGGSGTRLWPLSTATLPKQLVPLLAGRSLLDIAVERATSTVPADQVWLCAGEQLRGAVTSVAGLRADRLIVEPSGRDTLPAVALACAVIAATDPDAVIAVLTADHLIEPLASFAATLERAFTLAEQRDDALVTFGVVPDHPATGFGYLQLGADVDGGFVVDCFREKPSLPDATTFLAAGPARYLWNSGMFVWRASTLLRAVAAFAPEHATAVTTVAATLGTPEAARTWASIPKLSVDYGVMEPASAATDFTVLALPLDARWLDVGSWSAYGEALGGDAEGNAVGTGEVLLRESKACVVTSSEPGHLIALIGCEGLVVVHTAHATLIVPADRAQDVKALQAEVAARYPHLA